MPYSISIKTRCCACFYKLTLDLTSPDGAVIGCSVRRSLQARQPLYVAVGHRVSLATTFEIVHGCYLHRIPEPIRQDGILARATVRLRAGADHVCSLSRHPFPSSISWRPLIMVNGWIVMIPHTDLFGIDVNVTMTGNGGCYLMT